MNTRISQDEDRRLRQQAQFSAQGHYFIEAPGPGAGAGYVADPSMRLGRYAANHRAGGVQLLAELQGRTPAHRLNGGGATAAASSSALAQAHPLVLPDIQRAGLAGPFDTAYARVADPAVQFRETQLHAGLQRQRREGLFRADPAVALGRIVAEPVRMRGDTFVRG